MQAMAMVVAPATPLTIPLVMVIATKELQRTEEAMVTIMDMGLLLPGALVETLLKVDGGVRLSNILLLRFLTLPTKESTHQSSLSVIWYHCWLLLINQRISR